MHGEVTIRKNANPKGFYSFMAHNKPIFDVKLLKKRTLVTADGDGNVKIWSWNSSVPPTTTTTKFTCDVKCEIPGSGESDNVSIIVTPAIKPSTTTTENAGGESVQENSQFIIKKSTCLQIWNSEGAPSATWYSAGKPETDKKKAAVNEDALSIKDAKYSGTGDLVFVLMSDDSIRVLSDTLQPLHSTSPLSKLIQQSEHKPESPAPMEIEDTDSMSVDLPPLTCLAINPQYPYQLALGSSSGIVHLMEISLGGEKTS